MHVCMLYICQISYASTSVVLSNRSVYHSFFRTVPSDELLPAALATTMNYYGWRRLAIVTEDEFQYEEVSSSCDLIFDCFQFNCCQNSL